MEQDTGYRLLFSHPEMIRDLLLGYVPGEWIADADFSTLEHVNGSYVSDSERQRHDDMVWRVKVHDRWLWVYLILEFQSTPDRWMAVRMMVYLGLLAQHLIREGELYREKLPPILPIVLYNGLKEWKHPRDAASCFASPPKGLQAFQPRLLYHLVDEARLKLHPQPSVRNFCEALFSLEHGRSVADLRRVIQALDGMMRTPELSSLRRAFGVLIKSLLRRKAPSSSIDDINRINDIMEADSMLAERIDGWFDEAERKGLEQGLRKGLKQGLEQGREQGLEQGLEQGALSGQRLVLKRLLTRRFGELSDAVLQRLEQANSDQLECWADRLLDAATLDEVFSG